MAGINQKLIVVPQMASFEDVQQVMAKALNDLQASICNQLPITNYQSKRIGNVGSPQAPDDVVTLKYLQSGAQPPQPQPVPVGTNTTISQSGGGNGTMLCEVPQGTINGTNTVFTVTHGINPTPNPILELNGVVQDPLNSTVDFVTNGTNVIYTVPPETGAKHVIWYWAGNANVNKARFITSGTAGIFWGTNSSVYGIGGDLSIGMWVKPTGNTFSGGYLAFQGNGTSGGNDSYRLALIGASGAWNLKMGHEDSFNNQYDGTFTTSWPNDVWHYLGISRDSVAKTYTLYISDGVTLSTFGTNTYSPTPIGASSSCGLTIGGGYPEGPGGQGPNATIQEHYIWSRKLTGTEHLAASQDTPSSTNLVLYCLMGNTPEIDLSSTGSSGTPTNTSLVPGH